MSNEVMTASEIRAREKTIELSNTANGVLEVAGAYEIDSNEMYEMAGGELGKIKAKFKENDAARKAITGPLDEAKKKVMDLFRGPQDLLKQAETMIKDKMLGWDRKQEAIRQAEEKKAREVQEEARKKAEAEQVAADKAAAEAKEKGDEAAAQAAQEAKEKADANAQEAELMPTVVSTPAPKAQGVSKRVTWKAEVVDIKELCKAVAEGRTNAAFVQGNMPVLNKQAVSLKEAMDIPGVEAISEEGLASR